ncbi:MAG: hypothetical protein Q9188_005260 [Gyalolechia gomerana]
MASDEAEIHAKWPKSFRNIEKVLLALLKFYPIDVDPERDEFGGHSFHLNVLKASDAKDKPLHSALSTKSEEPVRSVKEGDERPYIGSRLFYGTVFEDLIQALKICREDERIKGYCSRAWPKVQCQADESCEIKSVNHAVWKEHAKSSHPEIFVKSKSEIIECSIAPAFPESVIQPEVTGAGSKESTTVVMPEVTERHVGFADNSSKSQRGAAAEYQTSWEAHIIPTMDTADNPPVRGLWTTLDPSEARVLDLRTHFLSDYEAVLKKDESLKEMVKRLVSESAAYKQQIEDCQKVERQKVRDSRGQKESTAKERDEIKELLLEAFQQKAAIVAELKMVGAQEMLRQVTAAGEEYLHS